MYFQLKYDGLQELDVQAPYYGLALTEFFEEATIQRYESTYKKKFTDTWDTFSKEPFSSVDEQDATQKKILSEPKLRNLLINLALYKCVEINCQRMLENQQTSEETELRLEADIKNQMMHLRELCSDKHTVPVENAEKGYQAWRYGDACRIELVFENNPAYQKNFVSPSALLNFALQELVRNILRRTKELSTPLAEDAVQTVFNGGLLLVFQPSMILHRLNSGVPYNTAVLTEYMRKFPEFWKSELQQQVTYRILKGFTEPSTVQMMIAAFYNIIKQFFGEDEEQQKH